MPSARRVAAVVAMVVIAVGLAACGKREVTPAVTGPSQPTSTVPAGPTTTTAPDRHGPPPTATNPPAGSGGTPAPVGNGREAERDFRKYCETHPGACGD
jgi:hypothetical protein